jgi:hypothetical protein
MRRQLYVLLKQCIGLAKEEIPSSSFQVSMVGVPMVGKLHVGGNATYTQCRMSLMNLNSWFDGG